MIGGGEMLRVDRQKWSALSISLFLYLQLINHVDFFITNYKILFIIELFKLIKDDSTIAIT